MIKDNFKPDRIVKDYNDIKASFESDTDIAFDVNQPICIRLDLNNCKTFTNGFVEVYDNIFFTAMHNTMLELCRWIQNCKFAYTADDEISLLIVPNPKNNLWFGNRVQKMCSVIAAKATLFFYQFICAGVEYNKENNLPYKCYNNAVKNGAVFDCRGFNIPVERIEEYFIWRQEAEYLRAQTVYKRAKSTHNFKIRKIEEYPHAFRWGTCCIKKKKWRIDYKPARFLEDDAYLFKCIPFIDFQNLKGR